MTVDVDDAPKYAEHTADLFSWAENYEYPTPFNLFLDLIGWSDENLGEPMFDLNLAPSRLGHMELGMLADALTEYADRPVAVNEYVESLMMSEDDED